MFTKQEWTTEDGDPRFGKITGFAVMAIVVLILVLGSFGTVSAGERGVKTRLGAVRGVVEPGLYFKVPLIEGVTPMEVKTRTVSYEQGTRLAAASRDLQDVSISTAVNYHIAAQKVDAIYAQYRSVGAYESSVIEPIIREVVKTTSAQYTAEELVTKRAEFSDKVNLTLAERFTQKDAVLERFNVTNFEFSKSFTEAIEAKVTAVQNAEAAKNKLEQVKFEAQQTIETAKANAEAIRIQAQAINSQGGADYVQLQAIKQWKGDVPQYMMSGSAVPFINLPTR